MQNFDNGVIVRNQEKFDQISNTMSDLLTFSLLEADRSNHIKV